MDETMSMTQAQFPDLKDAGVLITGGGSGIGASLVEAFAMQGAKVAFIDIAEEPSAALVQRLAGAAPHPVHFFKTDLSDIPAIGRTVDAAASATGGIKVLVNNAAWDDRHDIDTVTEAYWDANQAVNLKQMFFTVQAALPYLRQAKDASIVNFSSISFLLNMGELPSYAAAKAGIIGLTKSLAGRLGPDNIRVNTLLPGMIVTERQKDLWLTDDGIAATTARQCLKRTLVAADLAGPSLFLASSASSAITAQSIIVDGGLL
ncbi:SDR family NAD(P)-dependent oxidoreductase [Agrobacterium rhizogenes]|uniref:SDR family oxidoreductase n=2 Tax=Rhizobiaceae TaxID=82115 RepID=A0ABY8RLV3_9HYPH|nr:MULTISPECIES: SDR family oxidoreductase [Rhizobium/Agrobacterium group]MCZ7463027.1 SDR family NAD(P)-dependent oxidoreductase [Rhizobium rhizogenes]MCZ7468262.1 SDR family NAD(P)-dependent oxidoreductase [Rhizobium rhizogenes]MCZ7479371.1 SDR family NAD(P)-dependent oxidoreductase [Rhizobium rhizogenes]MCZ7484789.1 SDR family NAD(P)-dependent oxidoreductase [Rhizobium rhizogenes]WHO08601.1 SDR family oxidoreductase [Agrobacterium cucumeris]